jgi:hypothetical protein
MPSYFYPLQINSSIQNFLINHLILIHLIYFQDFMIFFFFCLPLNPSITHFLLRFFLLSSYYSSHLFHLIFSTSHSIILLSPISFPFPIFSLFFLLLLLFLSSFISINFFHSAFNYSPLTYSYCIYSTSSSSHHFIRLSLSLTTPHLPLPPFFFFFFFSLSLFHLLISHNTGYSDGQLLFHLLLPFKIPTIF